MARMGSLDTVATQKLGQKAHLKSPTLWSYMDDGFRCYIGAREMVQLDSAVRMLVRQALWPKFRSLASMLKKRTWQCRTVIPVLEKKRQADPWSSLHS